MELTPEERSRIYAEEKMRFEFRETLKRNKPAGIGWTIGVVILSVFLIFIVLGFIGMAANYQASDAPPPEPSADQLRTGCQMTILQLESKSTSELSISQLRELRFCKTVIEK